MMRSCYRNAGWLCAVFVIFLATGSTDALSQIKPPEQVQMQFHRAETAWRNQTSILEAKVRVDQVLRDAPTYASAWKLRAEVLIAMERYADAMRDAEQATLLDPQDGDAFLILAEAARLNNQPLLARNSLKKASNLSLDAGADFHIKLSRSAALLGEADLRMAESFARVALAKEPDYAEAYYQLARVFVLQERTEDAATTLQRGFQAELLDPVAVSYDSLLSSLTTHPSIEAQFDN